MACVYQFHDELPGTSVAGVYIDNETDYQRVERLLNDTLDASRAEIAARLGTRGEGQGDQSVPVVGYNLARIHISEPTRRLSTS